VSKWKEIESIDSTFFSNATGSKQVNHLSKEIESKKTITGGIMEVVT
jgi:hypothetical protein